MPPKTSPTTSFSPSTPDGWSRFYSELIRRSSLPETAEMVTSVNEFSKRDLVLDLSTIQKGGSLFVCGDVITLSSNETTFDFSAHGGFLFVVGRTFSATASRKLNIKVGRNSMRFMFYMTEVAHESLSVVFTHQSSTLGTYSLTPNGVDIGVIITFCERASRPGDIVGMSENKLQILEDEIQREPLLVRLIQTQLRIGILTMYTYPSLSLSLIRFICQLTRQSRVAAAVHMQASIILGQLLSNSQHAGNSNVWFVPSVTVKVYESTLDALLNAASSYSAQYDQFITEKANLSTRRDAARCMIEQNRTVSIAQIQLLAQARTGWEHAQRAMKAAQDSAKAMEREVLELSKRLAKSLEIWAKEKRQQAVLKIVTSLISLSVSLGTILAGNILGAAGASSLIVELATLVKDMKEITKVARELTIELTDLSEQFHAIDATVSHLNESIDEAESNINALLSGEFDIVTHARRLSIPDPDGTNAVASWDAWIVGIERSMKMAIDEQIPTSSEYLVTLKRQAIYGRAQCLTKAAAAKAGQEYARVLLQSQTMAEQRRIFGEWADDMDDEATLGNKSTIFFDNLLSIKSFVISQLRNYKSSYEHFTLCDSTVILDMNKSLVELQLDFAIIKQELVSYLSAFSCDPQPFHLITLSNELPLNQRVTVTELRSTHQFTFMFNRDNRGPFMGLFRVRLSGLRIWLIGAKPVRAVGATVKLRIETNGLYEDFSESSTFTYATKPLRRAFWYELEGVGPGKVLVDSVVPDGFHNPPTPFAQWTVSLVNPEDVDLSGLTSITIEWIGTAYVL